MEVRSNELKVALPSWSFGTSVSQQSLLNWCQARQVENNAQVIQEFRARLELRENLRASLAETTVVLNGCNRLVATVRLQ